MLNKVKLALRVTASAFVEEITDLIAAAKADLRLVGINVPESEEGSPAEAVGDPLIERAIILYAKAEFGYSGDDRERYRAAYDYLKCALSLAGGVNK